ncbi:hypothetical protein [Mucilaginibacter sp.]|uniref:hypothetical protein n=1 Tax=Mucilaginibacter sp. TaxID=1882438 RepID=UPI00263353E4|nr:hypothetical protein [Mucilaginibacter sp.]MDB4921211.1 hypothetical protein [Mucilaginibacter sp.]
MSVLAYISQQTVAEEISTCQDYCKDYGWLISSLDEVSQSFTVTMESPIDQQQFIIHFSYDNYPETPYLIDFIHPESKIKGTPAAYPKYSGDSFFNQYNTQGVICHPCSRKSYSGYTGIHADWQVSSWRTIAGGLTNLCAILDTIYSRISNRQYYVGRMV